jgi:uncharacterized membrane-anchored protein
MTSTIKKFGLAFALVAVVQIGALLKMAFDRVSLIKNGREITLPVLPVDPRDIFRGEYVILGYGISPVTVGDNDGAARNIERRRGGTAYVTLKPDATQGWVVETLTDAYPKDVAADRVVLKGRIERSWSAQKDGPRQVALRYGIESYFVPEGQGKKLEQDVRSKKIQAIVAVGGDGTAALKGLVIDGERHVDPPLL